MTLHLDLPLEQTLSAAWRGYRRELALSASAARGLVHLGGGGWLDSATVEMEGVVLTEAGGGAIRAEALRTQLIRRPPAVEGAKDSRTPGRWASSLAIRSASRNGSKSCEPL